ncbi:hypothetical protein KSS87_008864, partial [Heliosperma pusillum]
MSLRVSRLVTVTHNRLLKTVVYVCYCNKRLCATVTVVYVHYCNKRLCVTVTSLLTRSDIDKSVPINTKVCYSNKRIC